MNKHGIRERTTSPFYPRPSASALIIARVSVVYTSPLVRDNTYDAAGNRIATTPTGSGASPWTKTFNIIPQFHPSTPDTDNFNRTAVEDDDAEENVITVEPDFLGLTREIKYGDYADVTGRMSLGYDKYLRTRTMHSNEGTKYLDITLTRDFTGNIIRRQEPANSPAPAIDYEYEYDGLNRLASGEDETDTYDEISNLVTKGTATYQYQDPDEPDSDQMRLAKFNNGTEYEYSYDANGNPTAISNRFSSMSYDNLNMLRQIVHSQTDDYWYNAAGLRVKKTEDAGGTWKTTYTLYEGDNSLMQEVYTASGRIQIIFNIIVNGQILTQYKRVYPSTDSVVYFYLDYLNSRRVVIDDDGDVLDRYRYSAWGEAIQDDGTDDYRSFTGKDYDATGLIYFNARYYDPMTGRFMTEDPSRKGGNWYAYCGNNPIVFNDPNGEEPVKSQSGTISEFIDIMNKSISKSGLKTDIDADKILQSLSTKEIINLKPRATVVEYFNSSKARYVYTTEAGWVDMVHFLFYSGLSRKMAAEGSPAPVFNAYAEGYNQERWDQFIAPWSAFSYEDLPSDYLGAYFGAVVFDPNSRDTLGKQIFDYLTALGATLPEYALNWDELPQVSTKVKPTYTNKTNIGMFQGGLKSEK